MAAATRAGGTAPDDLLASKVYLVHRRDSSAPAQTPRKFNNPKIEVVWDSAVTAVHGESSLRSRSLANTKDGSERQLASGSVHR